MHIYICMYIICCDLKVVAILRGLQTGYIKYMCFICDWDSRHKGDQYLNHTWLNRKVSENANANVIQEPLVPQDKVLLPPLHIKLGIVKSFLKTVVKYMKFIKLWYKFFQVSAKANSIFRALTFKLIKFVFV